MSLPRRLLALVAVACLPLALPAAASAAATQGAAAADGPCRDVRVVPTKDNLGRVRAATLCLLNQERTTRGLAPLHSSGQLRKAATEWSRAMVRGSFFDHVSPQGSTMLTRVRKWTSYLDRGVRDWALGENLGWGTGPYATPLYMVQKWMGSQGHRDNILNRRFRHVGIGVARGAPVDIGGDRAATYTTDFGYRAS